MRSRQNSESEPDDGPDGPLLFPSPDGASAGNPEEEEGEKFGVCALCRRMEILTRHHLIPRSRHRKPRMRRQYTRHEMRDRLMMICRPCHTNLHRSLTEQELAEAYNTPEAIAGHADVARFTRWIERKPSGFVPP